MVLRPNKCSFGSESVEYCGFLINQHEYRVKPDRVEAINNVYKPKTVKQLRRYFGMCNQLRDFVKNYALIERRLTRLYKLSQPKHRATTKSN